ncbi:coiled-coil domain-containing protein 117 isoform X2 [Triplophysa dalaica]|uniref:coiled-coil domain-containing protein 117 isoform X2 n=1 Tax=Triplophysa dalaica TaxID=1582913 RepID=UPI0024DF9F88|nr:coiled-coil domain-containing protein 117 isoform X2 [Triplophysa dalaica]
MMMQSHMSASSELEFIMFSHHAHFSNPNLETISGPTKGSHHFTSGSMPNAWERRCMRKQRRRTNDGSCSTKRRKLMGEEGADVADHQSSKVSQGWSVDFTSPSSETSLVQQQTRAKDEQMGLPYTASSPLPRVHHGGSGMEAEVAQRRLQEIEERITLEDDSDEELDVEPAQRRPVLVMSESLREGLQRGIGDILPHTVAQSMNQSCMELVLWRPPEDPLTQRLKDSLQKQQRKQLSVNRQTPTPIPTVSSPPPEVQFTATNEQAFSPLFSSPSAHSSGEEDMEL